METPGTAVFGGWFHVPGFEGLILVAIPMHLPRIGPFVLSGSRLLEGLLEHRLVEEPGGEGLHAVLVTVHFQCTSDIPGNVTSAR